MLKDIVAVQALESHRLFLQFEDGVEGIIDLGKLIDFSGIFALSKTLPTLPKSRSIQN